MLENKHNHSDLTEEATIPASTSKVRFVSDATALLSMRDSDFDAFSAIGEVIDNSIQADAENIKITLKSHPNNNLGDYLVVDYMAFGDDGHGMEADTLHRCLQLGYSSRYNDRSGIGRFGVGMTLGAINQCKMVEVYSKQEGGKWLYTYMDIDGITSEPPVLDEIPVPIQKDIPPQFSHLVNDAHGTLVIWSNYDKQPDSADKLEEEMDVWVGRSFRKFIWGDVEVNGKKNKLNIEINNKKVLAIDPLHVRNDRFPSDVPSYMVEEIKLEWPVSSEDKFVSLFSENSTIKIQLSLLDKSLRDYQGVGNSPETLKRYLDRNEGISILRNGREVFYGEIPYWKPAFEDKDRWWGGEISFDAVLDKSFAVKNIKRGAVPVANLKSTIRDLIVPTIKNFREQISEHWKQRRFERYQEDIAKQEADGTATGHENAETIAKNSETQKKTITPDSEQKAKDLASQIKGNDTAEKQAAWAVKFTSQPYTIVDEKWKSPEFIEIHALGGADVIKYNLQHPFIEELYAIVSEIKETSEDQELPMKLKSLIDLLLISYAKSESTFDKDKEFKAETFFEELKMNWGRYLKTYLSNWKSQ